MVPDTNEILRMMKQIETQRAKMNQAWSIYENSVAKQVHDIRANMERTLRPIWSSLSGIAETVDRIFREAYPPNWPTELELDWEKFEQISETEGIPIFYVPRAEVVIKILDADDFKDRMSIINDHSKDIGQDCLDALSLSVNEQLKDRTLLARKAARAFLEGHYEAAQTLAVAICDSYLKTYLKGQYKDIRETLELKKSEDIFLWSSLRFFLPMATAVPFLEYWNPRSTEEPPIRLLRHVTIHGASTKQINELHATVALILVATMTRALDAAISRYGSAEEAFNPLSDP